jgi:4-methyl-5(b-hydroxyethyl)-thiazole monophosphate biosynthesis
MKRVLMPLADGFEEIESVTIVDMLRRAGVEVVVAGVKRGELVGSRNVRLLPDKLLEDVKDQDFDMVVLPGGQPGVDNLRKNQTVLATLKKMDQKKKLIGAICAAPLALRDAGLIEGHRFTSYPGFEGEIHGGKFDAARVVVDGRLVTSRGPGTAMEFALKLVEILCGKPKAEELSSAVLAAV